MNDDTTTQATTQAIDKPQKPKAPKALVIGLAVSIVLNLGLVGFIAGRIHHPKGMMMAGAAMQMMKMARALPEQDRTLVRDTLKQHRDMLKNLAQNHRAGRDAVKDALTTEPFDLAKLTAALAASREQSNAARDQMEKLLIEIAPKISPEGRQKLASLRQKNAGRDHMQTDMFKDRLERRLDTE